MIICEFTFIAKAKLRYVGLVNFLSCYWELVDLNQNISRIQSVKNKIFESSDLWVE
jgi:hypothetical protein